jgi:CheY-like chemotaxis protein
MALGKTVLIVEDDEELRRLYRHALALAGYEVKEARGGFEALRHLDSDSPDIVVLDLMMPGVDGFTVRNELAGQAHTRNIPIVVITGSTDDLQWLDVKCVLRKPVPAEKVVEAVGDCLASGAGL